MPPTLGVSSRIRALTVGDFKRSTDGGTLTNLTNLPVETPAGSGIILCSSDGRRNGQWGASDWQHRRTQV